MLYMVNLGVRPMAVLSRATHEEWRWIVQRAWIDLADARSIDQTESWLGQRFLRAVKASGRKLIDLT